MPSVRTRRMHTGVPREDQRQAQGCLRSRTDAVFIDARVESTNLVLIPVEQDSQHTACGGKVRVEIDGSPWRE